MVVAEFSMFPVDKGPSLSAYVARVLDLVDRSGLPYRLGPMGTCLEGTWEQVMSLIQSCYQELAKDCDRIYCNIKVDCQKGPDSRLDAKIRSVQNKLGRTLRT